MNNPMLEFLRADGSIVVNKRLMRSIGLEEAVLYSELVSKHFYFEARQQLDDDGYFFNVSDNILYDTGLTAKRQSPVLAKLIEYGLVQTKVKGIPARKYFKINQDMKLLTNIMLQDSKINSLAQRQNLNRQKAKVDMPKGQCNNTNTIILSNNPKENIDYILLTQNDGSFISYYLSVYADVMQDRHPTLTIENKEKLDRLIEYVKDYYDYETWCDSVDDHFDKLPARNNGSIVSFMHSSGIYFDTGEFAEVMG
jgi:hypothetical protein